MKAVMISIQPKWCEKIANKEKTIEVRKTRPKISTPFKCYIYCTIGDGIKGDYLIPSNLQCGKVVGEFVCDWITDISVPVRNCNEDYNHVYHNDECKGSCLTWKELQEYGKGKPLYAWHISDLVIYDKPKELSEFKKYYECGNNSCGNCNKCDKDYHLTRPPQSWCYVEEL